MVHLTNDAVQKHSPGYGAHEPANKLSMQELQVKMLMIMPITLIRSE